MTLDPYNPIVRACFENPVHATDPTDAYAVSVSAVAAESERGCRVTLIAGIDDDRIAEMRFRAWGCPFLIAAAEMLCAELEGQKTDALGAVSANDLGARLSVPATRLGRLLLLEDAAARLLEKIGA